MPYREEESEVRSLITVLLPERNAKEPNDAPAMVEQLYNQIASFGDVW